MVRGVDIVLSCPPICTLWVYPNLCVAIFTTCSFVGCIRGVLHDRVLYRVESRAYWENVETS